MRLKSLVSLVLPVLLFTSSSYGFWWTSTPDEPVFVVAAGRLSISGPSYVSEWSASNGRWLFLQSRKESRQPLLTESGPLWQVRFADGGTLTSSDMIADSANGTFEHSWDEQSKTLTLRYGSTDLAVTVRIVAEREALVVRGTVERTTKAILRLDVPAHLIFPADPVKRVVFPQRAGQSFGIAFSRGYFQAHTAEQGGSYRGKTIGTDGHTHLFGAPLKQVPDRSPAVALRVTDEGKKYFSGSQVRRIETHHMEIVRPPAEGQMPLVLVDSDNGPALCGADFGGKGLLMRFTGKGQMNKARSDQMSQTTMVMGASSQLARERADAFRGKRVAVIALKGGPQFGSWTPTPVLDWCKQFEKASFIRQAGAEFAIIETPGQLRSALTSGDCALILNPYGEGLPTGDVLCWREDLGLIRDFVRAGGIWWEVGGYPFYRILESQPYLSYKEQYPSATADFVHIESGNGNLAVFGVQPLLRKPWDKERVLVPVELETGGEERGGFLRHGWHVAVEPGQNWTSPPVRIAPALGLKDAIADYATRLELDRTLAEKMSADTLEKVKNSVLIRTHGRDFESQMAAMEQFPAPNIVHFSEYLHGGFDKQYPDHLPVRESWGTNAQFAEFYRHGKELGLLMMPYTNTSWWCIEPKGPTYIREGEVALARKRDGGIYLEAYGSPPNRGHKVCFWHPAVQAAHRKTRQQMSVEFPSDILMQDQVGARTWYWDYHDANPTRTAAIDGMHSLSMEDAETVPLATEDGYDRVAQFEAMLCGMAWAVVPSDARHGRRRNVYNFPAEEWENFPLMQYLAHDKAIFTMHDLGHFVLDTERIAYMLGYGYSLSYVCDRNGLSIPRKKRWLYWLDAVQKRVCSRYAGQPLVDFVYPNRRGDGTGNRAVMVATYPNATIIANVGTDPVELESLRRDVDFPRGERVGVLPPIAGPGFYAFGPGFRVAQFADPDRPGADIGYAATFTDDEADVIVHAAVGQNVILPRTVVDSGDCAATVTELIPDSKRNESDAVACELRRGRGRSLIAALPDTALGASAEPLPKDLLCRAPTQWPDRPTTIAVIDLGPDAPTSWVEVPASRWLEVLQASPVLASNGYTVVAFRTVAEIAAALTAPPAERPLAIVNPGGECFYAANADDALPMLDRIAAYVRSGGIWWETGGFSFHSCGIPIMENGKAVRWDRKTIGAGGATRLGFGCAGYDVDQPAEPLVLTEDGQDWFGPARAKRIADSAAGVQRSFSGDREDIVLVRGAIDDFCAAIRCGGWGWLWRLGGFSPPPAAAEETVVGVLEHLATHPWGAPKPSPERRLWHVRVTE